MTTRKHDNHNSGCPEECHIEMLNHPERWPHFGRLPLKHRSRLSPGGHGFPAMAIVTAFGQDLVLFEGRNLFSDEPAKEDGVVRTAEEIVRDGWVVD